MKQIIIFFLVFSTLLSCKKSSNEVVEEKPEISQETNYVEMKENPNQETIKVETEFSPELNEVKDAEGDLSYLNLNLNGHNTGNINLQDLKGNVVFINYWGSWCPPCRKEMPSIQKLYDVQKDKVKFVMIAMERKPGMLENYLAKEGFTFPIYQVDDPIDTKIKPRVFPTTYILDKTGKIRVMDTGMADWNAPSVHQLLDELNNES